MLTGLQTPGGMTTQAGIFGTGNGGKLNLWSFRDDISTQIVWQLQNFGFGNMALIKKRRGEQSRATAELFRCRTMWPRTSRRPRPSCNRRRPASSRPTLLATSLVTFQKNLEGLGQTRRFENVLELIYRPQEVVYALKLLKSRLTSISARSPSTTPRNSSCSTPWAIRPGKSRPSGRPATSCRWTRRGQTICLRWAPVRRRQRANAQFRIPSSEF